jgi:hypothetical protein
MFVSVLGRELDEQRSVLVLLRVVEVMQPFRMWLEHQDPCSYVSRVHLFEV